MYIGGLRHRVTLLEPVKTKNARLETVVTYDDWRTASASVLPESGREFYRAKQENTEIHGLLGIRYLPGLKEKAESGKLKIRFKDRIFDVVWVRDWQERKVEMRIAYKEAQ